MVRGDVGDEVPEVIHVDDSAGQSLVLHLRLRDREPDVILNQPAKRAGDLPFGQPRRRRREEVTPVERGAFGVQPVLFVFDLSDFEGGLLLIDIGQQPVVRRDEVVSRCADQQRPPARAHAGIDDRHMDRAVRKIAVRGLQEIGGRLDLLGRHMMREVHETSLGINPQDDPLHARDKVVAVSKVGQQGDE